jgi:hypothetical protein
VVCLDFAASSRFRFKDNPSINLPLALFWRRAIHISNSETVVTVKLAALESGPDFVVPLRFITLTKEVPSIRIGRASKQESKGFVAARENAWFDSPVMSRDHAELIADFGIKVCHALNSPCSPLAQGC